MYVIYVIAIDIDRGTVVDRVVVVTTAQLHSTKPELRFCAGSNPARGVLEFQMVRNSDNSPGWI